MNKGNIKLLNNYHKIGMREGLVTAPLIQCHPQTSKTSLDKWVLELLGENGLAHYRVSSREAFSSARDRLKRASGGLSRAQYHYIEPDERLNKTLIAYIDQDCVSGLYNLRWIHCQQTFPRCQSHLSTGIHRIRAVIREIQRMPAPDVERVVALLREIQPITQTWLSTSGLSLTEEILPFYTYVQIAWLSPNTIMDMTPPIKDKRCWLNTRIFGQLYHGTEYRYSRYITVNQERLKQSLPPTAINWRQRCDPTWLAQYLAWPESNEHWRQTQSWLSEHLGRMERSLSEFEQCLPVMWPSWLSTYRHLPLLTNKIILKESRKYQNPHGQDEAYYL